MTTLEKQNDRRGGFGSGQWLAGESMTMKTETPRTDELSNIVQNQNWGFRDMQILAGQLERELNNALADKKRLDCAAELQVNMEIVENCAGNIERYMVALNRHNLDKLISERVAEPANGAHKPCGD